MDYSLSGSISAAYVYGNGLISQVRKGVLSVYLIDGQQNTRALTDAAGKVTDQYIYDAFGRILSESGSTINRFLFAGQQADPTSGLTYMRARFYSAALGRFTSADPLRQLATGAHSFQFYVYAQNDPANRVDPAGKEDILDVAITTAVIGGLTGAVVGFATGGIAGAGQGFLEGFVLGFLSGAALAGAAVLAVGAGALETGVLITEGGIATGLIGGTAGVASGLNAAANAQSVSEFVGGITQAIVSAITLYQGYRTGRGPGAATGGDTPEIQRALQTVATQESTNIEELSRGIYRIGPDAEGKYTLVADLQQFSTFFQPGPVVNGVPSGPQSEYAAIASSFPADRYAIYQSFVEVPPLNGPTPEGFIFQGVDLGHLSPDDFNAYVYQRDFQPLRKPVVFINTIGTDQEFDTRFINPSVVEPPPEPPPPPPPSNITLTDD
jgi:RHS repeat-associated protein